MEHVNAATRENEYITTLPSAGTLRYRRILESNCGLNDKFMFPYNLDMTYDDVAPKICGHENGI